MSILARLIFPSAMSGSVFIVLILLQAGTSVTIIYDVREETYESDFYLVHYGYGFLHKSYGFLCLVLELVIIHLIA